MTDIHPSSSPRSTVDSSIPPGSVSPGEYVVDPARSELRFKAKAFTLFWVRGRMPAASGTLRVRDGKLSGSGEIEAAKVSTGVAPRDWHLRSSHYLGTKRHPTIEVTVDGADVSFGTAQCAVTVRGATRKVTVKITSCQVVEDELHLEGAVDLDRSPFPMLSPLAGVSRNVQVELTVVARRS